MAVSFVRMLPAVPVYQILSMRLWYDVQQSDRNEDSTTEGVRNS